MISIRRTLKILKFIYRNRQYRVIGWYWRNRYFHKLKPAIYLDGYKDGSNTHSWEADLFLSRHKLPLDTKLSHKQLKEAGFYDWLGREAPKLDYYILRDYSRTAE